MDTLINSGLTSAEIMDIKMAETLKRKKHRRGKKNRVGKKSPGNIDDFSTFDFDKKLYVTNRHRNRKLIRPSSPKAPMNSTQFLIEDRGHDKLDIDCSAFRTSSPPFQGLSPETDDFTSESFYDVGNKTESYDDPEYKPINVEDTFDFIGHEFEKDFNSYQSNLTDNVKENNSIRDELTRLPKFMLINKMLELEANIDSLEDGRSERGQGDLKMKMKQLREKNSELKSENLLLKSLLS